MVAHKMSADLGIECLTLVGGKTKQMLLNPIKRTVDILISTPGVLSKMITTKIYSLHLCKHFVLDETDTLFDDSFLPRIKYIINKSKVRFFFLLIQKIHIY